jgi:hypothetical protein
VLRNQIDNVDKTTVGVRKSDLLGSGEQARATTGFKTAPRAPSARVAQPAPLADKARVEVIRGVQKSRAELDL